MQSIADIQQNNYSEILRQEHLFWGLVLTKLQNEKFLKIHQKAPLPESRFE